MWIRDERLRVAARPEPLGPPRALAIDTCARFATLQARLEQSRGASRTKVDARFTPQTGTRETPPHRPNEIPDTNSAA